MQGSAVGMHAVAEELTRYEACSSLKRVELCNAHLSGDALLFSLELSKLLFCCLMVMLHLAHDTVCRAQQQAFFG